MATRGVNISLEGDKRIRKALKEAPGLANTFIRQVFTRHGKRWRKVFKKSQLRGRPGIKAPSMAKLRDKNTTSFTDGKFENLAVFFKISRFLRWHTEGATIRKRGGGGTFNLPARLKFRATVDTQVPPTIDEVGKAALRAVRVSIERRSRR